MTKILETDTTNLFIEVSAKVVGGLYQYVRDAVVGNQSQGISIATIHHKADVVVIFIMTYGIQHVGVLDGLCF